LNNVHLYFSKFEKYAEKHPTLHGISDLSARLFKGTPTYTEVNQTNHVKTVSEKQLTKYKKPSVTFNGAKPPMNASKFKPK
jgi:hypothetical protein